MVESVHYYSLPDGSGYGDAAMAYMEGLLAHGLDVRWTPFVILPGGWYPWDRVPANLRPELDNGTDRRRRLLELMSVDIDPGVLLIHGVPECFPLAQRPGSCRIGYTVWETTHLPLHWPPLIRGVDGLLVPCDFNVPLFSLEDGPPVFRIPHIADERLRSPDTAAAASLRRRMGVNADTCLFYNISSWSPRKAIWDTLHAYLLAFSENDDVCLVLKTDPMGEDFSRAADRMQHPTKDLVADILSAYPDPARVVVLDEFLPGEEMRALHGAGDCYFSLAHSEGWGIGAFEAGASGNPVVMTGWGGQCDYLEKSASYLVNYTLIDVPAVRSWMSYGPGQKWARADIDHAIELLQVVYRQRETAAEKGARLSDSIFTRFNSQRVTADLVAAIDHVHS